MKLLIAEDDARLLKSLLHVFTINKFSADGVSTGTESLEYALTGEYDGLILDIMMPGMDGIEVLKTLRRKNITTPALFLTARTEVSQRVDGLDAGADDYLPKPFSTAELLARVRAMLRRKENYTPDLLTYGNLTLNCSTHQISYQSNIQMLSQKRIPGAGNADAKTWDDCDVGTAFDSCLGMGCGNRYKFGLGACVKFAQKAG